MSVAVERLGAADWLDAEARGQVSSILPPRLPRLLAGPPNYESLNQHLRRLGPWPAIGSEEECGGLIEEITASGVRGRGGAGFPVGLKWQSVAEHAKTARKAIVVANGSEGEPASRKDQTLMELRPHLVLDGAALAAEAVGASEVILYVGRDMAQSRAAIEKALSERRAARLNEPHLRMETAPERYAAGEASAAVHRVNGGVAKPTFSPPRTFERGVGGAPTLVQNVESLAHVALIARFGAQWYRELGTATSPGTTLLTVAGAVQRPGVIEVPLGTTVGQAIYDAGGPVGEPQAVLLGGYFGTWLAGSVAWDLELDYDSLAKLGGSLGCGLIMLISENTCGLAESARILRYLAGESAGQCGPCVFGLAAMAETLWQAAFDQAKPGDRRLLERWAQQTAGRGACHHPEAPSPCSRAA